MNQEVISKYENVELCTRLDVDICLEISGEQWMNLADDFVRLFPDIFIIQTPVMGPMLNTLPGIRHYYDALTCMNIVIKLKESEND